MALVKEMFESIIKIEPRTRCLSYLMEIERNINGVIVELGFAYKTNKLQDIDHFATNKWLNEIETRFRNLRQTVWDDKERIVSEVTAEE